MDTFIVKGHKMNTDHPTIEIYFVFAFTYCKLKVYKSQEAFARRILEVHEVEFQDVSDRNDWQEIDTRVLLDLVSRALTQILPDLFPKPADLAISATKILGISQ